MTSGRCQPIERLGHDGVVLPPHLPGVLQTLEPTLDNYGYLAVAGFVVLEDFGVPVPGETILIVEDDDGVRQYAAEILRDLNYQVLEARDSITALKLLDADKNFDLLLTDVVLPGKNGRELATEIERRRPGIKIIFMTGYSRNAIVHQGRLDRGTELIPKPLTEAVLARRIRLVLDSEPSQAQG